MMATVLSLSHAELCGMRAFVQHELPVNSNISQAWTCPYRPWCPQRSGLYPDPSCVLLYCLSQTCIPRAAIRPGHVTDQTDRSLPTPADPRAASVPTIRAEPRIPHDYC